MDVGPEQAGSRRTCALRIGDGHLHHTALDPSEGIELQFGPNVVKMSGRIVGVVIRPNVTLFGAVVRHRLAWIPEADQAAAFSATRQAVIVDDISVK